MTFKIAGFESSPDGQGDIAILESMDPAFGPHRTFRIDVALLPVPDSPSLWMFPEEDGAIYKLDLFVEVLRGAAP